MDRHNARSRWVVAGGILVVASLLPGYALWRLSAVVDGRAVAAYLAVISLATVVAYGADKQKAVAGTWRTPEYVLHLLALAGGWGAAWVAQRLFRHKTRKVSFQTTFWFVAVLHHFVAFDYLQGWRFARALATVMGITLDAPT